MARILVVDDEASVRKLVRRLLESQGHEVVEAKDGSEAVALAVAQPPALILLDIEMPKMNGLETLRRLRKDVPQAAVVMVSGIDDELRAMQALDEGARDYVRKPFDLEHLKQVVLQQIALAA